MARAVHKTQDAYLHDMLEAARLIHGYMDGVSFDDFWHSSEKRDAVAMRLSVLGESAHKIDKTTEATLSTVPESQIESQIGSGLGVWGRRLGLRR
jgi:uncharacterized protein with HEPN domain